MPSTCTAASSAAASRAGLATGGSRGGGRGRCESGAPSAPAASGPGPAGWLGPALLHAAGSQGRAGCTEPLQAGAARSQLHNRCHRGFASPECHQELRRGAKLPGLSAHSRFPSRRNTLGVVLGRCAYSACSTSQCYANIVCAVHPIERQACLLASSLAMYPRLSIGARRAPAPAAFACQAQAPGRGSHVRLAPARVRRERVRPSISAGGVVAARAPAR
jgi:hypothetical protein